MGNARNASLVSRLRTLNSPNEDINEDRVNGLELIEQLRRKPHTAVNSDTRWFWDDYNHKGFEVRDEPELYHNAKEFVEKNFNSLNKNFPFELTEWLMNWYRYMPDCLYYHWDRTGQVDWNIYFTLITENPPTDSSTFFLLVKALNVKQNQLAREFIYKKVAADKELRDKVLKYEPLPSIYTNYCAYDTIRRKVIKILHPPKEIAPQGSRRIFKEVNKLMKEEGIDFSTALKRVEGS